MSRRFGPDRWIGVLLLVQGFAAPIANFRLLDPAISAPPGFLQNAAPHASDVQLAALLVLVASACSVGIALAALAAWPRERRLPVLGFLALTIVGLAAAVFETSALRTMLALSQEFVRVPGTDPQSFEPLRVTLRAARNSIHYTQLLLAGVGLGLFYFGLFRSHLVPRVLAGAGVAAAALLAVAALPPLFGGKITMALLSPIGLCQLVLMAWLLVRGFSLPRPTQEGSA
jgi:hypothetical protein